MSRRAIITGLVAAVMVAFVLLVPLNGTLDTVKPCGEELACSVPRYRSLFLSFADLPAPFDGLNRISVPILALVSASFGAIAASLTNIAGRR